ncbi:MAG TPA: response regulator, partial [Gaiellaceae bacterium]|nr:response regulator [Gaiellaceae bacterium]
AGEVAELKDNINQMIVNLRATTAQNAQQDWLNSNLARFSAMLQGQRDVRTVARLLMSEVTPLVAAHHGALYVADTADDGGEPELQLVASYGYKERKSISNRFKFGESLVGQSALERKAIVITAAPDDYIKITSGLGEAAPTSIIVIPILFEESVLAVLELASFTAFTEVQETFLDQLSESIGVVLNTIQANMRTEALLEQSQTLTQELQSQSEELQAQQDELKRSNTELEEQAATLRASEELLQTQQEELQQSNEELEEKAQLLEEQNRRIEVKNQEIELARAALEERAEQLALSSRYKSEFLANMSHELRTPLNSLLILAKLLGDNSDGNLTDKQIEFARTIHTAGSELLGLINDILDLSKVEAGKMDIHLGEVTVAEELAQLERTFGPLAEEKGLSFELDFEPDALATLETDPQRLQQILKNLLSNAVKFTEQGSVQVRVGVAPPELQFAGDALSQAERVVSLSIVDTGIGIAPDKVRLIFEAFQQADGTTSRRFGGTGLGLSISREIARLLGGEIHVTSTPGEGSVFTLYLPERFVPHAPAETGADILRELSSGLVTARNPGDGAAPAPPADDAVDSLLLAGEVDDDRDTVEEGDRVVLIVEDDPEFARTELTVAREHGFKGVVALRGDTGLALAHEFRPDAIVLDMSLPVLDGWTVLDRLKRHPATRHIPVHIVSGVDERQPALMAGAAAFVQKPATLEQINEVFGGIETFIDRDVRRLLVVDDDETQREAIIELVGSDGDVEIFAVGSSEDALTALEEQPPFDCMVLDLKLPKMTGFALLEKVKSDARFTRLPVIVYTGKELTRREETKLKRYAETIVVKDARSPERLLDETSLFLHRVEAKLPDSKRKMLEQLHSTEAVFVGKKVLIVDDDVRNVFALTSALEANGMEVVFAENGREGIESLQANPDVDLVLMDVMMPELDGYETTKAIRQLPAFERLPIIALTAKAMKGDRERSIASGASDYITKPVDTDQLLSLMRVWLYQ